MCGRLVEESRLLSRYCHLSNPFQRRSRICSQLFGLTGVIHSLKSLGRMMEEPGAAVMELSWLHSMAMEFQGLLSSCNCTSYLSRQCACDQQRLCLYKLQSQAGQPESDCLVWKAALPFPLHSLSLQNAMPASWHQKSGHLAASSRLQSTSCHSSNPSRRLSKDPLFRLMNRPHRPAPPAPWTARRQGTKRAARMQA